MIGVLTDKGMARNRDRVGEGNVGDVKSLGLAATLHHVGGTALPCPLAVATGLVLAMMTLVSAQLGISQGVEALSTRVPE